MTPESVQTVSEPLNEMKICSFLWVYYGYPTSTYEGVNVENMRYECGKRLAQRDAQREHVKPDLVAGVPDSGTAHAIGYANESEFPSPAHLSNIHQPGPVPLCLPGRNRGT